MDGSIIYRTREDLPYTDAIFSSAAQLTLVYNVKQTDLWTNRCQCASQNWKISQLLAVRDCQSCVKWLLLQLY